MARNEITNRKRFLDAPTLENAAAMAAANILPSQAALFTRSSTGELFTRGQMAYVQGFSRMAQDLIDLSPQGAALPSDMSPSDSMLNYLQKIGASFVCLYHNAKTKEIRFPVNHCLLLQFSSNYCLNFLCTAIHRALGAVTSRCD